nr:MAG TPA: hypothetical protein [Caudoviricetes sp.]
MNDPKDVAGKVRLGRAGPGVAWLGEVWQAR